MGFVECSGATRRRMAIARYVKQRVTPCCEPLIGIFDFTHTFAHVYPAIPTPSMQHDSSSRMAAVRRCRLWLGCRIWQLLWHHGRLCRHRSEVGRARWGRLDLVRKIWVAQSGVFGYDDVRCDAQRHNSWVRTWFRVRTHICQRLLQKSPALAIPSSLLGLLGFHLIYWHDANCRQY